MEIGASARKHGVADEDIRHAVDQAIAAVSEDERRTLIVGPARDGSPLEVVIVEDGNDEPVAIHAAPLRPKFRRLLRK